MRCAWCGRELGEKHGYSETGQPTCSSYSNPPNKAYCACKARKNRLEEKRRKAQKASEGVETPEYAGKREIEASSTVVGHLTDGIQIMINQLEELISLQRQQLAQPRTLVKEETIKTIQTTREFSTPDFEDDLMDGIEIKQDKSTDSVQNFLKSMNNIQNIGKVQ